MRYVLSNKSTSQKIALHIFQANELVAEKQLIEYRLPRGHERVTLLRVLKKVLFQNKEMQ